jgi:hypothetical protein
MTDPCGHSNSTHPSGCWYIAVVEAVAAERGRIAREWAEAKRTKGSVMHDVNGVIAVVDAIIEGDAP